MGHRTHERTGKTQVAHTTESPRREGDRKQGVRGRKDVPEDMWAYTREDLEVTNVQRKDEANIDSDNDSEYDSEYDFKFDLENDSEYDSEFDSEFQSQSLSLSETISQS